MSNWIVTVVSRYRTHLILLVLMQLGCGLLVATQPRFFQQLVSLAISKTPSDLWSKGLPLLGCLAAVYLSVAILQSLGGYLGSIFSTNLLQQLQTDFFEKTSQLPLEHFRQESAGEFFTTFANDIGQAQRFFASLLPGIAREVITTLTVATILLYFCPFSLTIAAFCIVIVVTFLATVLNRIMGRYAREQRTGWGTIHRVFDETIQGIDTLKTLAAEKRRCADFQVHTGALRELSVRAGKVHAVFSPGIELFSKICGLGLIALAYFLISKGLLQVEPFLIFFFYTTLLQLSVSDLAKSLSTVQTEYTGVRRLASFLEKPIESEEQHLTELVPSRPVTIKLADISFSYPQGRHLYSKTSMVIPARRVTLVHGKSGSGKSTLINLLLRFYAPDKGNIFFNEVDICQIPRAEIRKKIGVVTQNHFIFQETLRANLLVAQPDANDLEITRALERAQLGDFLVRMPKGINTIIEPGGRGMSAGEKQRLCIARLLLRQSPIMILDEPWANLDLRARERLAEVINSSKKTATILVLSHDSPETLVVDQVYHLDEKKGVFVKAASHSMGKIH